MDNEVLPFPITLFVIISQKVMVKGAHHAIGFHFGVNLEGNSVLIQRELENSVFKNKMVCFNNPIVHLTTTMAE